MRTRDLAAHQTAELLLQRGQVGGDAVDFIQANDADFGVFQRDGGRHVLALEHAVHADDLAGQVETGDLDLASRVFELRLQAAEAHAIDRIEGVIQRVQRLALFKAHAFLHQFVQLFYFGGCHAHTRTCPSIHVEQWAASGATGTLFAY